MSTSVTEDIRSQPYITYRGWAAEDIKQDSVVLKIICPELIPNATFGTLAPGITESVIKLQDRDGRDVSSTITSSNHIVATWEGQSNLRYPPMIRKGEPVEVYKVGNQDKFEWRASGKGRNFRSTDRVTVEVSATDPTKPGGEKNDANTYSAYLDSENKKVGFKTSKANGEATAFSMEVDLAKGIFHITDDGNDPGNRLIMDTGIVSGVPMFQINLSTGVTLKFENEDLYLKIPGKFQIDAADRIVMNSPLTVFNVNKKGVVIFHAASVAFDCAKDFVVNAGSVIGLNAVSTKIGGMLVAGTARIANAIKGVAGTNYKPASIQRPSETPVVDGKNSPDTSTAGVPYRSV